MAHRPRNSFSPKEIFFLLSLPKENRCLSLLYNYLPTDEEITGSLTIKSNPSKAEVYVDKTFKGLKPLVLENLKPKSYLIEIIKIGYKKISEIYEIAENDKIIVEKPLEIETPQPPDEEEDIFTGPNF